MAENKTSSVRLRDISRSIWALGFVSMLMDISSEMIHSLLPVYLVTVLGASMATVGLVEGIAEATASIVKVFSGAISDWLGRRKMLAVLGYGIAALTKPIFPLASTVGWVVGARFIDRIGKGIRGAPRDALIADISPPHAHGASFGLRQSLDTIGAFIGPLIAIALMWWTHNHFQTVFWWAVVPALMSVLILVAFVREPAAPRRSKNAAFPLKLSELKKLSFSYWLVLLIAGTFTLSRFSEAFLILKAEQTGLPFALAPVVLVVMNIVYAATAYPLGAISDRVNRIIILTVGYFVLICADMLLANADSLMLVFFGIGLWGLHLGLTQSLLMTLVADTANPELRGTAFGIFHLLTGVVLFMASLLAGVIWDQFGSAMTFQVAAGFAVLALIGIGFLNWKAPHVGTAHLRR